MNAIRLANGLRSEGCPDKEWLALNIPINASVVILRQGQGTSLRPHWKVLLRCIVNSRPHFLLV